jgi:hypothetical protein
VDASIAVWLVPSPKRIRSLRRATAVAFVPTIAAGALSFVGLRQEVGAVVAAGVGAIIVLLILSLVAFMIHYRKTIRIYSEREVLGRVDPMGRRHEVPLADLDRVVEVSVAMTHGQRRRQWLFLDHAGRCVMTLLPAIWIPEELDHLLNRIQVPLTVVGDSSPAVIGREYPGAYPWWITRRWALPVATVLLIVILAIPIAILTTR